MSSSDAASCCSRFDKLSCTAHSKCLHSMAKSSHMCTSNVASLCVLFWVCSQVCALSLNPFAANVYWPDEIVPLSVNKVSTNDGPPRNYYDLPFVCQPKDGLNKAALSLDEVLRGDRLMTSDIRLRLLANDPCHLLCTKQLDENDVREAYQMIAKQAKVEWYVDGLPGATAFATHDKTHKYYSAGFPMGQVAPDRRTYLNNHFTIVIKYRHSDNHDDSRVILAFEVYPRSVLMTQNEARNMNRQYQGSCAISALEDPNNPPALALVDDNRRLHTSMNVTYSYSVYFREDFDIHWVSRWNLYFYYSDTRIVWYYTAVSATICLALTVVVGGIFGRTLSSELRSVSKLEGLQLKHVLDVVEDDKHDWKVLHNDVFRSPRRPEYFPALIGSGTQLIISLIALLIRRRFASFGLFGLLFAAVYAGYQSGHLHRSFHASSTDWIRNGLYTALGVPTTLFSLLFALNFFIWIQGASSPIPLSTILELMSMWLGASVPLVLIGAYTGSRKPSTDASGQVRSSARKVPPPPFFNQVYASCVVAGALPYAAIAVQLYFILRSFKLHQDGYLSFIFSSLSLVAIIAIFTTIEVSVTMTYLLLQHGDYRWHWRAFLYGSASTAYIFAHAVFYFFSRLNLGILNGLVYYCYTIVFCLLYGIINGTFGYASAAIFVHKIYRGRNKIDRS